MSFSMLILKCEALAPALEKVGRATRKASEDMEEHVRYNHELTERQAKLIDQIEERASAFGHITGKQFMVGLMNLIALLDEAKRKGETVIAMRLSDQIMATRREMEKLIGLGLTESDVFGLIEQTRKNRVKRSKKSTGGTAPPGTMP